MAAPTWLPNHGHPPIFYSEDEEAECPPDLFAQHEAENARVFVALRNGERPAASWPVIGRPIPTRWTLNGEPYDIKEWRRA